MSGMKSVKILTSKMQYSTTLDMRLMEKVL